MKIISLNSADALLFDLGGVVLEIDFNRVFVRWAAHSKQNYETIKAKFSADSFYNRHERGEISSSEYFDSLRASLGINISDAQFADGWNDIFVREVPGIAELLQRAQGKIPLYAFSNSNATHHRVWSKKFAAVLSLFHTVFVSSELGKRKPEPEAFHAITEAIGVLAPRIVFFDDSLENVAGARAIGWQTVHVRTIADIEESLRKIIE
ncbi:MAG: HAD family phosphatase [Planctomycetota bacterium]